MKTVWLGPWLRPLSILLFCMALTPAQAETPAAQTLPAAKQPTPAPDFELPDLEDRMHKLSDYRGNVVVLNFWATWCPPCRYEMPSMQRAAEKTRDEDIVFLGVDVGEDQDTVFTFLADYPVDFPLLLDRDASVIEQYPVTGLPTTYIIDPEGRITHRAVGGREWDDDGLLQILRGLLPTP
ncbi:MAG: TlpA disulfide reductase family protein [Thiohalobacteraceae bacterium]